MPRGAAQRQVTAVWLALANMLVMELNPASLIAPLRPVLPRRCSPWVRGVVGVLLQRL